MNIKVSIIVTCLFLSFTYVNAQDAPPENWFNLDKTEDGVMGISTEKTYKTLLKGRKSTPIIVAVIDSGVEPEHDDLKNIMWVNPNEIAGNNKDDDGDTHIDDINGWSFIGGANGDVNSDTYEVTRLYAMYKDKYANADPTKMKKKELKAYTQFKKYESDWKNAYEKAEKNAAKMKETKNRISNAFTALKTALGDEKFSVENINNINPKGDEGLMIALNISRNYLSQEPSLTIANIEEDIAGQIDGGLEHYSNQLKYAYNPDFTTRDIVGDNWADVYQKDYGNNHIEGPDAGHGTHVSGIIAAERNNNIGMNGVADNVQIMSVRTVPDGDERDKDVANAIIYATDHGAKVINMSFGKGASPRKKAVDKAVRYAEKHDVLFVHAAGNDNKDIDMAKHFPDRHFLKHGFLGWGRKTAKNWIEVGASSWKPGENMVAEFSNYGRHEVDVFAPGVDIYSTVPDNGYDSYSGTSMASPVTAGLAALLRSYFPQFNAQEIKQIIKDSVVKIKEDVIIPGGEDKVPFTRLCNTGGIINTYKAVELAIQRSR